MDFGQLIVFRSEKWPPEIIFNLANILEILKSVGITKKIKTFCNY